MTRSRTLMVPFTRPARRAVSASIAPSTRLDSPCTSEAQAMSPSTVPSTCRSAVAETLPLMTTSAPSTEKVALLAMGRGAPAGERSAGFFENIWGPLQEGARIDHAVVDTHLEVEVGAGRTAGAADRSDHVARGDLLSGPGHRFRHVCVTREQTVTV